jgi:hypothetical protein
MDENKAYDVPVVDAGASGRSRRSVLAHRLVLATGVVDELPDVNADRLPEDAAAAVALHRKDVA